MWVFAKYSDNIFKYPIIQKEAEHPKKKEISILARRSLPPWTRAPTNWPKVIRPAVHPRPHLGDLDGPQEKKKTPKEITEYIKFQRKNYTSLGIWNQGNLPENKENREKGRQWEKRLRSKEDQSRFHYWNNNIMMMMIDKTGTIIRNKKIQNRRTIVSLLKGCINCTEW